MPKAPRFKRKNDVPNPVGILSKYFPVDSIPSPAVGRHPEDTVSFLRWFSFVYIGQYINLEPSTQPCIWGLGNAFQHGVEWKLWESERLGAGAAAP